MSDKGSKQVITIDAADGWEAIDRALSDAQPGDEIVLGPGTYASAETLNVPTGVTLRGEDGARIEYEGDTVAIKIENADGARVSGLRIDGYRGQVDAAPYTLPKITEHVGLVSVTHCSGVILERCAVRAFARFQSCISVFLCEDTSVTENRVVGAQIGIAFWSSSGDISQNFAGRCGIGIFLERSPSSVDLPSNATVRSNRCFNGETGISLRSAISQGVENNECGFHKHGGIELARSSLPGAAFPSSATIRFNRCHENGGSGLLLTSSVSPEIAWNECWRNGLDGISLKRDDYGEPLASEAAIRCNRCHENGQAGIILFESRSSAIEENLSWGNHRYGIVLHCSLGEQRLPSEALVRSNQCIYNLQSGIIMYSSQSDGVEGNFCWGNNGQGILLQAGEDEQSIGPSSTSKGSTALIKNNQCHHHGQSGIALLGSSSQQISGNDCWSNGQDGITAQFDRQGDPSVAYVSENRLQANGQHGILFMASTGLAEKNIFHGSVEEGVGLSDKSRKQLRSNAPVLGEGNREDPSLDLPSTFFPNMQASLAARISRFNNTDAQFVGLISFLVSGATGAFRAVWTGSHFPPDAEVEPKTSHAWSTNLRAKVLDQISLGPASDDTIPAHIANRLIRRRQREIYGKTGEASWAALISPEIDDLAEITEAVAEKRSSEIGGYSAGRALALPITVAMEGRETSLREGITEAIMEGRSLWFERLSTFAQTFKLAQIALVLAALAIASAGFGWPDTPQGILAWIGPNVSWLDPSRLPIIGGVFSLVLSILLVLALVDIAMPPHLRFLARRKGLGETPSLFERSKLANAFGWVRVDLSVLIPGASKRAEIAWQLRKIFDSGAAALLVLETVEQWRDGDIAWLARLSDNLPEGTMLTTLIHVDGRISLKPLVIDPLEEVPWAEELEIFLNDDEERLRFDIKPLGHSMELPGDFVLLGAQDAEGAEIIRNELADDEWVSTDLLASLPLASAPTGRAQLRAKLVSKAELQTELIEELLPAARGFFVSGRGDPIQLESEEVEELFPPPGTARAIHTTRVNIGRQSWRVAKGRVGTRAQVSGLIRAAWPKDRDWAEYVHSALRFGIWQRCRSITAIIAEAGNIEQQGLLLTRHLDAIRFLGQDIKRLEPFDCTKHGTERFVQGWSDMRSAIRSLPAIAGSELLIARYWAAEAACFGEDSPSLADVCRDVNARLFPQAERLAVTTAYDACCDITAERIRNLRSCDRHTVMNELAALGAWHWRDLPPGWVESWRKLAEPDLDRRAFLVEMLAQAASEAELKRVVQRHAAEPARTIFALGHAAVRHAMNAPGVDRDSAEYAETIAPIGTTIFSLIEGLRGTGEGAQDWLPRDFAREASAPIDGGDFVFEFLGRANAAKTIAGWLSEKQETIDQYGVLLAAELEHVVVS